MPLVRRTLREGRGRLILALIAVTGMAVLSGCGTSDEADLERGRTLFIENCGTCHTLAQAATTANLGPDLDAAFMAAREAGMDEDTIQGVVRRQIEVPREVDPNEPDYSQVFMPADIVTGDDARDVAAYVASVAGIRGIEPPEAPGGEGGQVFANNGCAACHTLSAAGASGTVGPNLDETLAGQTEEQVRESILDPDAVVVSGFPAGTMPSYEGQIDDADLDLLIEFLLGSAGGGNGAGAGNGGG